MNTFSVFAPTYWAPAIINLDYSGYSEQEISAINTFMAEQGLSFNDCLDCKDAGFMWVHDADHLTAAAECSEYFFKEPL